MADYCEFEIYPGNYYEPQELCPNEAVDGEEYCPDHLPDEPDPDLEWKERLFR